MQPNATDLNQKLFDSLKLGSPAAYAVNVWKLRPTPAQPAPNIPFKRSPCPPQ